MDGGGFRVQVGSLGQRQAREVWHTERLRLVQVRVLLAGGRARATLHVERRSTTALGDKCWVPVQRGTRDWCDAFEGALSYALDQCPEVT